MYIHRRRPAAALIAVALAGSAPAGPALAQSAERPALEPIPDGAPQSIHDYEPSIVVRPGAKSSSWEYRVGGRVVGLWVQPPYGPPYFLSDRDGDGILESRRDGISQPPTTAQWRVFSW